MFCNVIVFCGVHVPGMYAASHVDHVKRAAWFSISIHVCGSLPIVTVFSSDWWPELHYKLTVLYFCFT